MKRILSCLVIDDDEDDLEIFLLCVRQVSANIDCRTANNGHEALLMFESDKEYAPGYIFLDVNMPKMNGRECLISLKKIERLGDTKFFMYSTTADNTALALYKKLGATDFILKPSKTKDLKEILSNLFSLPLN
jgi:CheY-like chemotaxis protein